MAATKSVHTLVLDSGAIIKNEPPVSTLLSRAETLVTVPAILSEIKDATTRSRVETTLRPFLTVRAPNPASIKFVTDFARRTGDLAVLSRPDIQIIALTYEIECERNGGDWRLRRMPGQKRVNGAPPQKDQAPSSDLPVDGGEGNAERTENSPAPLANATVADSIPSDEMAGLSVSAKNDNEIEPPAEADQPAEPEQPAGAETTSEQPTQDEDSDSDSGGWITPSNLKKKQAEDSGGSAQEGPEQAVMQAAVLTTDFAMQNVILQINLNLLSSSLSRVRQLKTFVLRCHACFQVTKDMTKQFCPNCGQATLTRVSCSTNANGEFRLHLKKNMQWNTRGDRYSIPKPVHGSASGRGVRGGGKSGWGNELILAEDQKEYQKAVVEEKRHKELSLMDDDYLPGILTGERHRAGGRVKVGAGRNVNTKKR